jgi:tetratricopeptide (TPR) repeat protein
VRLRRWLRKRPRRVTAAAVLLLTAVVGLTLGTVLLQRSKVLLERSRQQSENSYQIAKKGVHHFLREVSEDVLLDEPGMQPLRLSLLDEALRYYEGFLLIRPDDPEARQQLAETYRLRGGLDGEVGRLAEGKACLLRAVDLYEGLLRAKPEDMDLRFGLARCWLWLAKLQVNSGEEEPSQENPTETVTRAVELLTALLSEEPQRFSFLGLLGRCHDLRATAQARRGDLDAALRDNREALDALKRTARDHTSQNRQTVGGATPAFGPDVGIPGVPKAPVSSTGIPTKLQPASSSTEDWASLRPIATALVNKGMLLEATGRTAASARAFQEAADHLGYLSEQYPRSGRLRHKWALALLGAGSAELELGRPAVGERDMRRAVALLEKLVEQDPLVLDYRGSLLRARGLLGECLFERGQHQAAAAVLRDAVKRTEELVKAQGRDHPLLPDHPRLLCALGCLEADSGRLEEALHHCKRAAQLQMQGRALAPRSPARHNDLLRAREALSGLRRLKGEIGSDDRILEQRQILRQREELAGRDPLSPRWRSEASASAAVLAGLLLQAGRARAALDVVEQVLPRHEALLRADQERWTERGDRDQRPAWESGLQFLAGIRPRRVPPPSLKLRSLWAELLAHKGAALAATGQGAAASEVVARAVVLSEEIAGGKCCYFCPPWSWPSVWSAVSWELFRQQPEPCYLLDLAHHQALASTMPQASIPDPGARAVQALRRLAAAGFDNPHKLQSDERLASLRRRQDFHDLLRQLHAQAGERPAAARER